MSTPVTPSEATLPVQDQGGDPTVANVSIPAAGSEAGGQVQESRNEGQSTISPDEERRRQEQSIRDRARHEARMELQRQMEERARQEQAEKERKMLAEMDDEDYGRYVREQQKAEATRQEALRQSLAQSFQVIESKVLETVSDSKVRQELAERAANNEFKTFEEFHRAVVKAEANRETMTAIKKRETELREAFKNGRLAEDAAFAAPQTGSGLPTAALNPKNLSSQQKMALAYARGPSSK